MMLNPSRLPKRMDFHEATKDLPLPRATRSTVQVYLATRTKDQIKKLIEEIDQTIADVLRGVREPYQRDMKLYLPKTAMDSEKKKIIQQTIFLKAVRDFIEAYYQSLLMQKKL